MSIVDPTIVELAKRVDCRYTLCVETAKRARQIIGGSQPYIDNKDMKPLKQAVEEINRGLIGYDRAIDEEEKHK